MNTKTRRFETVFFYVRKAAIAAMITASFLTLYAVVDAIGSV